jgi:hypothetical protein
MGLFSDIGKKFKQATGVDPMFLTGVEDIINDPTGAKKAARIQADALRQAGQFEEARRLEELAFAQEIFDITKPQRIAAGLAREQLQLEAQVPLSENLQFQRDLQAGVAGLKGRLGVESSALGLATGQFAADLAGQHATRRLGILGQLAGGGTAGLGLTQQARFGALPFARAQAQGIADIGALQAAGSQATRQFFSGIGADILGTAGGFALGSTLGVPPAATAGQQVPRRLGGRTV